MQVKHMIILINALFILAWMFGFSGKIIFPIFSAAILAVIALCLHWYKNIMINRLMLIAYVCTIFIVVSGIIFQNIFLPEYFVPLCIYILMAGIGIYTTFWTQAGFIGVEGRNKTAIRRASLILLSVVIIAPLFIYFILFEGYPRNISPFFVFFLIYKIAKGYAEDAQHMHEVE